MSNFIYHQSLDENGTPVLSKPGRHLVDVRLVAHVADSQAAAEIRVSGTRIASKCVRDNHSPERRGVDVRSVVAIG